MVKLWRLAAAIYKAKTIQTFFGFFFNGWTVCLCFFVVIHNKHKQTQTPKRYFYYFTLKRIGEFKRNWILFSVYFFYTKHSFSFLAYKNTTKYKKVKCGSNNNNYHCSSWCQNNLNIYNIFVLYATGFGKCTKKNKVSGKLWKINVFGKLCSVAAEAAALDRLS